MRLLLKALLIGVVGLATAIPCWGADSGKGKSLSKALLLSLALPGAGEAYMGASGRAKTFFVSEAGVWSSFAYFRVQGRMREDRYKEMARLFAGVDREMNADYYTLLAYYTSSEDYNIDVLREARLRYPDDRAQQLAYFDANGYFGDRAWEWQDLQRMDEYARVRILSRRSYRRAVLTTGFAVLNRMISMIEVYLSFRLDQPEREHSGLGLRVEPAPYQGIRFYLRAPF